MSLLLTIGKFIEKEELFQHDEALLCAVSGGIDSMVMLDLLRQRPNKIYVAHVNYMLRGADSDKDEILVQEYCRLHEIDCFTKKLTIIEANDLNKSNLQAKARNIRYHWFKEICSEYNLRKICVAHHKNDVVETFIMNSLRASGLVGTSSIKVKNGMTCRPLLDISKEDIEHYASRNDISYRVDKSNLEDKYDRNYIRNHILSSISQRWPSGIDNIHNSTRHLQRDLSLLQSLVEQKEKKWISSSDDVMIFGPIDDFKFLPNAAELAYHLLRKYNFGYDMVQQMLFQEHTSGATFKSENHEALFDRNHLIIRRETDTYSIKIEIEKVGKFNINTNELCISHSVDVQKNSDVNVEFVAAGKILWPLKLRVWEKGDQIKPLGMLGRQKKVSDILIDQKVNRFEKEKQYVLVNANDEIIWVVGRKLSEDFKCSVDSNSNLKLEWLTKL